MKWSQDRSVHNSEKEQLGTYVCPVHLPNVEELVISTSDDLISSLIATPLFAQFPREQTSGERRKWRRNVMVLELVHLPTSNLDSGVRRGQISRRSNELGRLL